MKKITLTLPLVLGLIVTSTAWALPETPQTTDSVSAKAGPIHRTAQIDNSTAKVATDVQIGMKIVLLPELSSPDFPAASAALISDAKNGAIQSSTFYTVVSGGGKVAISNLVVYGSNRVVWQFIDATSPSGGVSLDMLAVNSVSSPNSILNDTYTFAGMELSPGAVVKNGDSWMSSGSVSQKGTRAMSLVCMKLISGGTTASSLDNAYNWLAMQKGFEVKYAVQVKGDPSTKTIAGVGLDGFTLPAVTAAKLSITRNADATANIAVAGDVSGLYSIQFSKDARGPYTEVKAVTGGNTFAIPTTESGFYRAIVKQ